MRSNVDTSLVWMKLFDCNEHAAKIEFQSIVNSTTTEVEDQVDDPLSTAADSGWNRQFQDEQLKKLIMQDVTRTFPDYDYFRRTETQQLMVTILFVYCRRYAFDCAADDDGSGGYRQGMHEILAPVLFLLDSEGCQQMAVMGYMLFSAIMNGLRKWYFTAASATRSVQKYDINATVDGGDKLNDVAVPFSPARSKVPNNKLTETCLIIQDVYLRVVEPELWQILTSQSIDCTLYGLRWVKLLFGREVSFDQIPVLWSAIFSDDAKGYDLVEWLALALIASQKQQILDSSEDSTELMRLMLGQREVVNIEKWVASAKEARSAYSSLSDDQKLPLNQQQLPLAVKMTDSVKSSGSRTSPISWNAPKELLAGMKKNLVNPLLQNLQGSPQKPNRFIDDNSLQRRASDSHFIVSDNAIVTSVGGRTFDELKQYKDSMVKLSSKLQKNIDRMIKLESLIFDQQIQQNLAISTDWLVDGEPEGISKDLSRVDDDEELEVADKEKTSAVDQQLKIKDGFAFIRQELNLINTDMAQLGDALISTQPPIGKPLQRTLPAASTIQSSTGNVTAEVDSVPMKSLTFNDVARELSAEQPKTRRSKIENLLY